MARVSFVREDAEFRRLSLIEAAGQCLAESGIAGTSVRSICRRAGVSAGLLTHYFSGIDELILETYRDMTARVSDALREAVGAAGPDPAARLHAYVVANFEPPILDPDKLATWTAFWGLIKTDAAIAAEHRRVYGDYRREIERLIAQVWGRSEPGDDIRLAAVALTAIVDGLWLELSLDTSSFTPEEAKELATHGLESLLARKG